METLSIRTGLLPHLRAQLEINLSPGTIRVFTGENGVGKTTLLRHIDSRLGKLVVHCPQGPLEHFFERSLGKFRELLLASSRDLRQDLFLEFWKLAGFSEKENRRLSELSGGEGQLLKIILHASASGDVYLFDEPAQNLDSMKKKLVHDLFQRLTSEGKSLILVEHDPQWIKGAVVSRLVAPDGILQEESSWTT